MTKVSLCVTAIAALSNSVCLAQMPAIRQLGPVTVVGKDSLGAVTTVRQLPNGRVLVNDIVGRRVVMLDSSLSLLTVIADTTSATANAYGVRPGGLIAYRGDSTLFIDPASLSMLLIDPAGKIARVMSAPRANDVGFLVGGPFGNPGFDAQGRLIYRAPPRFTFNGQRPTSGNALPQMPTPPDSAALVRFDLATRKLDTVTWFKTPKINLNINRSPTGDVRVVSSVNPLPQGDDWAILPDGTIALVRGKDFHVDWVGAQGITSAPKIPFDWERLTDEGKVAFIDSARVAIEKQRASGQFNFGGFGPVVRGGEGAGGPPREGTPRDGAPREGGGSPGGASAAATGTMTVTTNGNTTVTAVGPGAGGPLPPLTMVSPSDLPDYKPAFVPGSTRADADGNLWIRTSQNIDARPVYDVVNRKGDLIDRVQLPSNRVLAGFGANGVVYLAVRDGATAHLEKARIR
ncbi:MAG TPA: hypothetical protein VGO33_16330 [Gemmatimonadaceae bacterium]|jgi:hypothetical protein|nr:hypothetical protein [Gemmatimonadaceae bacterium]